ncbi:MAG TPA: VOC family protein [Thermomicrobiaceae bacterium]|nr:VOC family protein [Thermomicrobiaceae bacterium]
MKTDGAVRGARYVHTNVIAADWSRLAAFYAEVFGCVAVPPGRDLSGDAFERGTGLPGAALQGIHLRLPGHGVDGPTLEIFQYRPSLERPETALNRPGLAHLAFAVADVAQARAAVLAAGGHAVGEVVTTRIDACRLVTWCYVTDPEGNVVELQAVRTA